MAPSALFPFENGLAPAAISPKASAQSSLPPRAISRRRCGHRRAGIAVGTDMDAFRRKARLLLKPRKSHCRPQGKAERTFVRLAHGLDHSIDAEAVLRARFLATLPQEHDPVGSFLKRTYTGEVFLKDQRVQRKRNPSNWSTPGTTDLIPPHHQALIFRRNGARS